MPSSYETSKPWIADGQVRGAWFAAYCMAAAFATYFCMYAFRKPFTAGTFEEITLWGIGYKSILVAAQVAGYTLSKFIGIKVISEMPPARRAGAILILIGLAELSLLGFALLPPPWNWPMLFFNGLPLGMVFGLVLSFLEGRQLTEMLAAGLCASFIAASGFVKSIGRSLVLDFGISEYWMPFVTGALFVLPLLLAVWALNRIPPPNTSDVNERHRREPMNQADRWSLIKRHALGLGGILFLYVILTVIRSFRDDFAVEIWSDLGAHKSTVFAYSETAVMFGVLVITGFTARIRDNRRAFLTALVMLLGGFVLMLCSIACQQSALIGPFSFMVLLGLGAYVPYVVVHTTIFERMLALFRDKGNIGYLMYLADSVGYLGYVGLLLAKHWISEKRFLDLFVTTTTLLCMAAILVGGTLLVYYMRMTPTIRQEQRGEAVAVESV